MSDAMDEILEGRARTWLESEGYCQDDEDSHFVLQDIDTLHAAIRAACEETVRRCADAVDGSTIPKRVILDLFPSAFTKESRT